MKILFISPHPGFGGASTANQNMALMMSSLGHDVIYMDEYSQLDSILSCIVIDKFPIHGNKTIRRKETKDYFKKNKYDMVFIGVPIIGFYYYSLFAKLKKRGVKICIVFHSLSLSSGLMARIDETLISITAKNATHLLFVSEFTKRSWKRYSSIERLENKSLVIYNAIKKHEKLRHTSDNISTISFVGRLSLEKNPELFCRTAQWMKMSGSDLTFKIFGNGPLFDSLKQSYNKYVSFMGYETNMDNIYSNSDILVLTSEFENCPMVILEAASYGIPCVAPNVGGISEIVKNGSNGLLFLKKDETEVAKCINRIIADYSMYSETAYNVSKDFSFESMKNNWENALKFIANE